MSQQHLKECSNLADELICLRTDMDKSMLNTVRSSSQSIQGRRMGSQGDSRLYSGDKRSAFKNQLDSESKRSHLVGSSKKQQFVQTPNKLC